MGQHKQFKFDIFFSLNFVLNFSLKSKGYKDLFQLNWI